MISFITLDPHIYRFSVTNYSLFCTYFNYSILFQNLSHKSKIFGRQLKNGTVFVKKASIILMTPSEQEKHLLIKIQLSQSKTVFVQNVSAKFEQDQVKDEEASPILI